MQIYWFGPLLGGIAGAKLYDVMFVSSSMALQLLKSRVERLVQRFSRPPADTAAARSDEASAEHWSTVSRDDGGMWRENSLYRTRSLLVDRAVQSELTTKNVAENCLAVTVDVVNQQHSPPPLESDKVTPTVTRDGVIALDEDTVIKEFADVDLVHVHRRHSYQEAIIHADNLSQPLDLEKDQAVSAAIDEIQHSSLDTVSELEEPDIDDALKEPGFLEKTAAEEVEEIHSAETSVDEILDADRMDVSSTRADILDNGFEELDVTVTEERLTASQTETSRSPSASVEDDFTVYDVRDAKNSDLPSALRESEKACLPGVSPSLSKHDDNGDVWIRQTKGDAHPSDCTASKLGKPDQESEAREHHSPVPVSPTSNQPEDGHRSISKLSSSQPPPPPIDVIAIDVTGQLLSEDLPRGVDESSSEGEEYRHSPLGGAMPESDDSSVGEFVFP